MNYHPNAIDDTVSDPDKLNLKGTQTQIFIKGNSMQVRRRYQFQFLKLVAHESQGKGGPENRYMDISNQVGQCADMIFMAMG